jgi:hypothetical protein
MTADSNHGSSMWIGIDDAIQIYARMLRARLGSIGGAKVAQETADHLRARSDWSGAKVWESVATELAPPIKAPKKNFEPGA